MGVMRLVLGLLAAAVVAILCTLVMSALAMWIPSLRESWFYSPFARVFLFSVVCAGVGMSIIQGGKKE
jgi:hypothetical protein